MTPHAPVALLPRGVVVSASQSQANLRPWQAQIRLFSVPVLRPLDWRPYLPRLKL